MISDVVEPRAEKADPQGRPDLLFIGMEQIEAHTMRLLGTVPFGSMKSAGNVFHPRDVIYGRLRSYLNKVHQPDFAGVCSGEFIVLPESTAIHGRFLKYRLNAGDFMRFASHINTGDRPRVDFDQVKVFPLSLPPLAEQSRIADVLDELFSGFDAGMAALERVREKMKLYRASILKAAVEGALTAEWRAQHPNVEPASVLLQQILADRRRRWEEGQLAKFKAKGQEPPRNWKVKYKEPVAPDTSSLPPLPEGWCWCCGDALFSFITSGSRGWARFYAEEGALFIRMGNLDHGLIRLDLEETQRVKPPAGSEGMRTRVKARDILVSVTADVGMIALVPDDFEEAYINQHVALARPVLPALGAFVAWYMASPCGGQLRLKDLQRGATKVGLGLDDIRSVTIPLPPLPEQESIVEAVEDQLSVIDHLEAELETKMKSAQALRQSILRHAFTGQLVPQAPNDEPASELLKRIAIERKERARESAGAEQKTKVSNRPKTGRRGRPKKNAKGYD